MKLTSKQILIIIAVVVLVFIVIGIWFYRKGKKTVTIQDVPLDTPGSTDVKNNPSGKSDTDILSLADSLAREMNGINFWRDNDLYVEVLKLSDTDTVKLYNAFNTKFQKQSGETLKGWIDGEGGIGEFATIKQGILEKFDRLKLI